MMDIFVKRNNTIDIPVWAWVDKDDNIDASHVKSEIPKNTEPEPMMFTFRRPTYQDSTGIIREALAAGEAANMDVAAFQDTVLRSQLVDWDIKDEENNPVPVNVSTVNELQPAIARAAVSGYLAKVKI
jgi:hypothetical protein